ncbi:MAG: hypothetical protein AB8F74_23210 [Saprospiraceae bacterium]
MNNTITRRILPHIGAYLIMMLFSFLFFAPYFQGKVLTQGDNIRAEGMQVEMRKFKDQTGEWPKWTNSMFAGMPTFQIIQTGKGNLLKHFFTLSMFKQGVTSPPFVILAGMFCMYLLLVVMKLDWRIAVIGAVGYGLSTYNIDLAEAGHSTKMAAMAFVPGVFAGALLAFNGRYLLGGGMFAFFLSLNIYANHLQITFYMGLLLGILGLVKLITAIRRGVLPLFAKAAGILVLGGILALSSNLSRIWSTQEYAAETIRGKSELASKQAAGTDDGLTKDYIFGWSYGKMESFTLLVPNFMGGGASHHFRGTKVHDQIYKNMERQMLQSGQSKQQAVKAAEQQVAALFYWGKQPFVGTAIYFGVVLCFLFFLGAFLVRGDEKVWLVSSAIFALMIAWGGNFFLNHFFVDYLPLFNKFRAVSMALGLSQLAVIILGMLGLAKLLDSDIKVEAKQKALYYAAGITGGLCVIALLAGSSMDMSGSRDGQVGNLLNALKADRAAVLRADVFRSIAIMLVAAGLIFAYLKGKLKPLVLVILIGLISVLDVWTVNKRILFAEKYETEKERKSSVQPRPIDLEIQKDTDPHYRVLDLSQGDPFRNANTSYFHKSIGGYHAAKLMLFQEVYEKYFTRPSENLPLLGMMNTKYIIFGQGKDMKYNKVQEALGNAWFVDNYEVVPDADAELNKIKQINPATTAVIQQKYAGAFQGLQLKPDPSANIKLTSYHPDHMVYEYSAASEQLALFSEVYYPPAKGWNVYLNGEPIDPFVKANYLIRGLRLPAGQNQKLEMRFEPKSFVIGDKISLFGSLLVLLFLGGGLFTYFKGHELPEAGRLPEGAIQQKGLKTSAANAKRKVSPTKAKGKKGKK